MINIIIILFITALSIDAYSLEKKINSVPRIPYAPLYHCEEENVYKEIPVLSEFCFGHGICNHQEYVKVLDHKYTECYPERKDNDD